MNSKNFKEHELSCPCCGAFVPSVALLILLEDVRRHFNTMIKINSSTRCHKHNSEVGGGDKSQHLLGTAADIVVLNVESREVYDYLNTSAYQGIIGLSCYDTFVHVDVRGIRARW
jgi:uncharacterized protein YcbK (DUF882 family)